MSMMMCPCCDEFSDTDDGEGMWDVPHVNPAKKPKEYVCGVCVEKYINEDEKYDPDLPEKEWYHDQGLKACAEAEDRNTG